jgi:hypothetical protein
MSINLDNFRKELIGVLGKYSFDKEHHVSNDILAQSLVDHLERFTMTSNRRKFENMAKVTSSNVY